MPASITNFDYQGKRVLVRCDFNVPLGEDGRILDETKIKETLPTLRYLSEHGAKIVIITHLGDPKGQVVEKLKLDNIAARLSELLGKFVKKIDSFEIPDAPIVMLENIRFHKGETENDPAFAQRLAALGDIFINEAFDVCHRDHASVSGIPKFLPHGAGFLLQKEVEVLRQIMQRPARPMVAIIGGAKVATKASFVSPFCAFADLVVVNGLIKQELIEKRIPLEYPEKVFGPKENLEGMDLSKTDLERITRQIAQAKTVFWNGPFGKIEDPQFAAGTKAIAEAIIKSGAYSVVGGGETLAFLRREGILDKFSHVSTAGGAMLEFLSGMELPGLKALEI